MVISMDEETQNISFPMVKDILKRIKLLNNFQIFSLFFVALRIIRHTLLNNKSVIEIKMKYEMNHLSISISIIQTFCSYK